MGGAKMSGSVFTVWLIAAWYSSNIGVLLLNKYLLSNYGFRYPIFLTMSHMTACALLSYVAIAWLKIVPMQAIRSQTQFMKIAALTVIFCTSVVSGNIPLRFLPVSFNQAVGATAPFFTAVFAYFLTLRREAWLVYGALILVVTSVMIASGGEPSFHLYDFALCIMATAARALKSVVQGILLSSEGEAQLHESVAVHGAHRGGGSCARDAAAGAQCSGGSLWLWYARMCSCCSCCLRTPPWFTSSTSQTSWSPSIPVPWPCKCWAMRRAPWLWLFPFCSFGIPSPSLAWWAIVSLSLGFFFTVKQNGGASDLLVGRIVSSETSFFLSILFVAAAPDASRVAAVAAWSSSHSQSLILSLYPSLQKQASGYSWGGRTRVWVFDTSSRHASGWWDMYSWGGRTRVWVLDTSGRHASGWCDMYSWGGRTRVWVLTLAADMPLDDGTCILEEEEPEYEF